MNLKQHSFTISTFASAGIYLCADLAGEILGHLGSNYECLRYIGCTSGFFGFDAIEHFLSGFSFFLFIAWLMLYYPRWSIRAGSRFKDILILISIVALISIFWEFIECFHDVFRLTVLHEQLYSVRLHINLLDQPSNLDTMGDLTFNLLGSVLAVFLLPRKK